MPLLGQPGVFGHGLALTEAATPAPTLAEGANSLGSISCQVADSGLPFMLSTASMDAAWALQPDVSATSWGEVPR